MKKSELKKKKHSQIRIYLSTKYMSVGKKMRIGTTSVLRKKNTLLTLEIAENAVSMDRGLYYTEKEN